MSAAKFGIYRESDSVLMEGGFFSKSAAEDYCLTEYNEPSDGTESYVVRPQS